jgi:MFS family permease
VAGCLAGVAVGWNVTNVGAVATTTADSYGIALATVGLFTTALFLTHLAMQVPGGRLVDRLGARRVCTLGVVIVGCGCAISLIAPDPVLGIGARALTGVGTGLGFIAGTAYVRRVGGSPFAQGLYGGIGLGAGGLALAVVPQLVGALSWRAPYVTALALAGVGVSALALAPRDHVARDGRAGARSPAGVLRDRGLYPLALTYLCSFGLTAVVSNWIVELLERQSIAGPGAAGAIGAAVLGLGIVTRPLGGWIMRSRPHLTRLAVGVGLAAGALGTALLAVATGPATAVVACLLLGAGGGISFAPAFTGAATIRPDAPAAAVGLVNSAAAATVLTATPLLGLAFSLPGDGRLGFAAIALVWLLALAALPSRRALGAA